ncbi:MAG: gfo/Idh/MocA family oxidoreductase [Spirochaetales bacterium]|nr:MAG: gfo/Idh/MocA family oxidoreductase [Spirochaetales bacterium]
MAGKGKEFRSNVFAKNPQFNYLPDGDRFLLEVEKARYRFNVIGTGIMGQEHMRVTEMEGRGAIHGIYDTNPRSIESARQMFAFHAPGRELAVYDSLDSACNDPAVDALILCTPNYTHIDIVRVAAKSGKHILLEKPMATKVADAREILTIAAKYKSVFQIGLQYRFKSIYREAIHEALERKSLGGVKTVSILEHRIPFLDKVNQWNKFSEYSGGTLVEKCCHYFDLLNLFAGAKPATVYASGGMAVNFLDFEYKGRKSDIMDNALVIVTYENGVRASFNLCMFSPMFYEEIIICGDEGRLRAFENEDYLADPRPKSHLEIICGEKRPSRISTPSYPVYIEASGHNGATYYEHRAFVDNMDGAKTKTASAEEGYWSIVVGAAAEESAHSGTVIKINDFLKKQ